jgi:hypothetical protein
MMCERCGIGPRQAGGVCEWCAAPLRARLPLWTVTLRRLQHSRLAAALRRRGAVATGVAVGIGVNLAAAALGVAFGIPALWQGGLFWSQAELWALLPETWQPWLFAAVRGAAYGALAGLVAPNLRQRSGMTRPGVERSRFFVSPTPATVVACVAFVVTGWDDAHGLQYRLVMAGLAAAGGRLTTLILRGVNRAG